MLKKFTSLFLALIVIGATLFSVTAMESTTEPTDSSEPTIQVPTTPPASAPKLVSVKNSLTGVVIKWKKTEGAEGYYVLRKTAKSSFKKIADVNSACVKYTDKKAKSNKKYTYSVKAYNSAGVTLAGKSKTILRIGTPTVKASNTEDAIKIKWSKVKGATKYVLLYKKHNSKEFKVLYKGKKQSYLDDNVGKGVRYDFKVKAYVKKKSGAYSNIIDKRFLEPTTLVAEELLDMDGITLRWSKVKGAKNYDIYRSIKKSNDYKKIATVGKIVEYKDRDVESIKSYSYYIIAHNGNSKSKKSNVSSDVYGYYEDENIPLYLTIKKGEIYKDICIKIKSYGVQDRITWKTSDKSVAKVSATGVITGVSRGEATLTASGNYEGKTRKVKIIVTVE